MEKDPRGIYCLSHIQESLLNYLYENGEFINGKIDDVATAMGITRKGLYNLRKKGIINLDNARMRVNGIDGYSAEDIARMLDCYWVKMQALKEAIKYGLVK